MTEDTSSFRSQVCCKQKYQHKESNNVVNEVIEINDCRVGSSEITYYDELGLLQSYRNILSICKGRNAWLNAHLIINCWVKIVERRFEN